MTIINLYQNYLVGSLRGMSKEAKIVKLEYEKKQISEIIRGVESLFENDSTMQGKKKHSIYVVIKKDLLNEIFSYSNKEEGVAFCKALLTNIVGGIEEMLKAISNTKDT